MDGVLGGGIEIFCDCHHVIEGIHFIQLAGVDDAHKNVGYAGAVFCFEKQCVFSMQNGFLDCAFADVVVEGCARDAQEESEFVRIRSACHL